MSGSAAATVPTRPTAVIGSEYATLKRQVEFAGLLDRSALRALPRLLVVLGLLGAGIVGLVLLRNSWWELVNAGFLAAVFAQLGFVAHEAGHQQVFRSRQWNDRLGYVVSNALAGLSFGWWVDKHNRHHRLPNDVDYDPDVARNVIAWTDEQAGEQRGIARVIARHQDRWFVPLLLLEAISLQVNGVRELAARSRQRWLEGGLLALHVLGGVAVLLLFMSPLHVLAFLAIQQGLLGVYLGMSFAPNHKGMPLLTPEISACFLRRQVLTSRNVRAGRLLSAAYGGLNFQIEHHLFPSMPSRNLRRARLIVKRFCAEHAVAYCETTPIDSYRQVRSYLRSIHPAEAQ